MWTVCIVNWVGSICKKIFSFISMLFLRLSDTCLLFSYLVKIEKPYFWFAIYLRARLKAEVEHSISDSEDLFLLRYMNWIQSKYPLDENEYYYDMIIWCGARCLVLLFWLLTGYSFGKLTNLSSAWYLNVNLYNLIKKKEKSFVRY